MASQRHEPCSFCGGPRAPPGRGPIDAEYLAVRVDCPGHDRPSLVFLAVFRRIWPATQRTEHNDIIGWQISVLGTTYAVILAFMLWNVWTNFQTPRITTEMEANYLVDLYRIAGGLETAQSKPLRALCRKYATVMVSEDGRPWRRSG